MVAARAPQEELRAVMLDMMSRRGFLLGMYSRTTGNHFEVWVVTQPLTLDDERSVYALAGQLRDRFPDLAFDLHLEHAGMYENGNPFDAVPLDAERFQPPV